MWCAREQRARSRETRFYAGVQQEDSLQFLDRQPSPVTVQLVKLRPRDVQGAKGRVNVKAWNRWNGRVPVA